jgi:hypothetical protein
MVQKVILRRGNITGFKGEVTLGEDCRTLYLHDGITPHGMRVAMVSELGEGGGGDPGTGAVTSVAGRTGDINLVVADVAGAAPSVNPNLSNPTLTGTVSVPTVSADTSNTQAASTAYVLGQAANTTPLVESGSGSIGSSTRFARADHVHPAAAGGGGGTTTVRQAALRNWKKSNTGRIVSLMGRAQSGFSRGRILLIGDSYTAGYAGAGNGFAGGRAQSFGSHLARAMAGRGMAASADWALGDGNGGDIPTLVGYDPRLVFTGASLLTDFRGIGGSSWTFDTAGDKVSFTPGGSFDTVEILVMANNTAGVSGNFDVFFNGSGTAAFTVASNDLMGVKKVTLTVPASGTATSVQLQRKTNATFIAGLGTRLAGKPGIEVINAGSTGSPLSIYALPGTSNGDENTWNTRNAATALLDSNALNVTIINGWYNDMDGGATIAATQTHLSNLITAAKAWGDVIFIGYAPLDPADTPLVTYNQWQDAMYATATAADIPIIDPPAQLPVYATGISQGMYGDPLHLNGSGHAVIGRAILQALEDIA